MNFRIITKLFGKLFGNARKPSEAEAAILNAQALRSI